MIISVQCSKFNAELNINHYKNSFNHNNHIRIIKNQSVLPIYSDYKMWLSTMQIFKKLIFSFLLGICQVFLTTRRF